MNRRNFMLGAAAATLLPTIPGLAEKPSLGPLRWSSSMMPVGGTDVIQARVTVYDTPDGSIRRYVRYFGRENTDSIFGWQHDCFMGRSEKWRIDE